MEHLKRAGIVKLHRGRNLLCCTQILNQNRRSLACTRIIIKAAILKLNTVKFTKKHTQGNSVVIDCKTT